MKRGATSMIAAGATAAAAVVLVACGSSDTSQGTSTPVQREAASKPAPERCPERKSTTTTVTIINKTERVLYPSAENWRCDGWSEGGNPSVLNGWAIGPGQEKRLSLERTRWTSAERSAGEFTINFRAGTYIPLVADQSFVRMISDGDDYCGLSGLFNGPLGPNTVRATLDCSGSYRTSYLTLESVPPKQPPA